MPQFSISSNDRLQQCHPDLRDLFRTVVTEYDCTVLVGHRSKADQTKAFKGGNSKVQWPDSKHNEMPSMAVDCAPYPIDWNDKYRFAHFAGYVQGVAERLGIKIRWGGDWDSDFDFKDQMFNDLVHFELREDF